MNYLESIIEDLNNGEAPELCLANLESYITPLTGTLPDNRDDMNKWV